MNRCWFFTQVLQKTPELPSAPGDPKPPLLLALPGLPKLSKLSWNGSGPEAKKGVVVSAAAVVDVGGSVISPF